jgi:hypothetical protein
MKMGMVDRGASLRWLSQYPHENEILFAPLLGLEAIGSRVDGNTLLVEIALSNNMNSLTLEQVVSKRRKVMRRKVNHLVSRPPSPPSPPPPRSVSTCWRRCSSS